MSSRANKRQWREQNNIGGVCTYSPDVVLFSPLPFICPRRHLRALGSMKDLLPYSNALQGKYGPIEQTITILLHHHMVILGNG